MRCAPFLLALLLLFPGATQAAEMTPIETALYTAAKAEGELTWFTGHYAAETAEEFGKAFSKRYPGVKVNVVRATGQVVFNRLMQELKAGVPSCDVFGSTDVGHYVFLKEKDLLLRWHPENEAKVLPQLRNADPDGAYHATQANTVVLIYNTDKVAAADAPRKWTDLLDPKWKGKVSLGHPGFSGTVGTWAVMMKKLYGWDYFTKLAKNDPLIGRSINDTVTAVNSGERQVAAGATATTLRTAAKGNPLAVIEPEDGVVLQVSMSAVMKASKHPNAAKLFIEWLMSEEFAGLSAAAYYEPVRPEASLPPPARSMRDLKTIQPSAAEIATGVPEVKEQWRETFGN